MPYYSEEIIERVQEQSDIVEVIATRVDLRKNGRDFVGLCPFHREKTPSFHVNPDKQLYHCFGCQASGSVFTFLMEYEKLTFPEAVRQLAQKAGVDLPDGEQSAEQKREENKRTTLIRINTVAATYYHAVLLSKEGTYGMEYFKNRRLTDDGISHFGLGYTGRRRNTLYARLKKEGYSDLMLKESGLFRFGEKEVSDIFWNRVIFPIMDAGSHVIGFGGRVLGEGKPKYLNSPETILFEKRKTLYGLNYAKKAGSDYLILCEGYMDVIALHLAGFSMAVAALGTAFTREHAVVLKRYVKEIYLSFDSDGAGIKAALRTIPILRAEGITAKVIDLTPYKDPDELLLACGPAEYKKRIKEAQNAFFFEVGQKEIQYDFSDPEQKTQFTHELAEQLTVFSDKVQRDNYTEAAAKKYQINGNDLHGLVVDCLAKQEKLAVRQEEKKERSKIFSEKKQDGMEESYRIFLSFLADDPNLAKKACPLVPVKDFYDEKVRKVAEILYAQLEEGKVSFPSIINRFGEKAEQELAAKLLQTDSLADFTPEEKEKAFNDSIVRIKENSINERMNHQEDLAALQELSAEKLNWQTPQKFYIKLQET